jgi:hypothetical protein
MFLLSCGPPKTLARDKASELIAASDKWKEPGRHSIVLGADNRRQFMAGFFNSLEGNPVDWNLVDALTGLGYLTETNNRIQLTEKGKAAESQWKRDPERPALRLVPLVDREFVGVTGILQSEGSIEAQTEFKWRWKWTPLVTEFFNTGGEPDTTDLVGNLYQEYGYQEGAPGSFPERTGKALLRRYDDGWRLEALEF